MMWIESFRPKRVFVAIVEDGRYTVRCDDSPVYVTFWDRATDTVIMMARVKDAAEGIRVCETHHKQKTSAVA